MWQVGVSLNSGSRSTQTHAQCSSDLATGGCGVGFRTSDHISAARRRLVARAVQLRRNALIIRQPDLTSDTLQTTFLKRHESNQRNRPRIHESFHATCTPSLYKILIRLYIYLVFLAKELCIFIDFLFIFVKLPLFAFYISLLA